ncbi:phage holin family protein [Taklimakanibacter deserti]|uniref:phage holin family protein n=1 Tax=Taklimakanibacter deserti TaxID=2267839 RepID=UPI000E650A53
MAKDDGKPGDETLSAAFEQLKRDGAAWFSAEQDLLQARLRNGVRRVELAALLTVGALMVTVAAAITLANMLVHMLTPPFGPVLASLLVAIILLIAGALLIVWVKSLLHPKELSGRVRSHAKVIRSALNEPN